MSEINSDKPAKRTGGDRLLKPEKKSGPKVPRTGRDLILHRVYLALTVVSAIIVVLFILYKVLVVAPNVDKKKPDVNPVTPQTTEDVTQAPDHVKDDGGERKKDFFTFLVVGRDTGGGGNTDTIMLAAYDVPNQELAVMSIPRDTMVNIPHDIKRINAVYNYYGGGKDGIDALYKEVSQLVGFRPDFEVVIEWKAVGELVDAIDGVDFDVPMRMRYYDPTQNLNIDLKKGQQHLDGDEAMQLIRFRHNNDMSVGYATGDIGRIGTQQEFLKAVIKKCLTKITDIETINSLAKLFTEHVDTDLAINNLVWFAKEAIFGGLDMENVSFVTMPGDYNGYAWSRIYENNQSYVLPYADEVIQVVNAHFNPFKEDLTTKNLDIMSVNSNGSLSSTTGVVEDSKAGKAPAKTAKPSPSPEPSPEPSVSPEPTASPAPTEPSGAGNQGTTTGSSPSPSVPSSSPSGSPSPSVSPSPSPSASPSQAPAETPGTLPPLPSPVETPPVGGEQPPEGIPIL